MGWSKRIFSIKSPDVFSLIFNSFFLKKYLLNIKVDVTTQKEVLARCMDFFSSGSPHTLFFLNAHCFNVAQRNVDYFRAIKDADLLLNDGIGIRIASWFSGVSFPENLNGTDLIPQIFILAAREKRKVFFLGGAEGVATNAAKKIKDQLPELNVAGTHHGFFQPERTDALVKQINESGAELVVLGLGVPKQELWACENAKKMPGVRIIIAGGAILDFISGTVKRAPLWMRKLNLEWLYRLMLEPGRMWKRYLVGGFQFFYYLFSLTFKKRL